MTLLFLSLLILPASSLCILILARFKKLAGYIFLWSHLTASLLGLLSTVNVLVHGLSQDFRIPGALPFGEFHVGLDSLSVFFLLLFFILSLAAGIYGYGYLRDHKGPRNLPVHFCLYQLLIAVIILIFVAKNAVLFLIAWELMTVVSYFLVTFYNEQESVRKAGYIYLIATHTGTFCLLVMFVLMGAHAGSFDFDQMRLVSFPLGLVSLLFVLGFIGFGVKAGFIPFHIWLPHAHPAAPTHISALLSGVVIKVGIYGLVRLFSIIKDFPLWCGIVFLVMAIIAGVGGVLYALGQHEIKKLLAYHSIENIGIIMLGLGMGLIGHFYHQETVAFIGMAAALLHTFNHAVFKGLLFLSAGSVIRATHTGAMDHMGGLLKVLPWSGHLFLIGSLSICGLPFFNGFISEWLAYRSFLEGILHFDINGIIFSTGALVALGLIGGLAALCFAKAFGTIFLGHSRSSHEHHVPEGDWMLRGPMIFLALICLWGGLFPLRMVSYAFGGAQIVWGATVPVGLQEAVVNPLVLAIKVLSIGAMIFLFFVLARKFLALAKPVHSIETWACGYAHVSSRMQYTASSFARPILRIFKNLVLFKVEPVSLKGYFPPSASSKSWVQDASEHLIFRPLAYCIKTVSRRLKWIQSGHTQIYILYILFLLVVLLIWKLH